MELIGEVDDEYSSNQIRLAFVDWKVWVYMMINFGGLTPVFGLSSFLPSIIQDMGYTNSTAQLLTVPPYVTAGLITIPSSWNADRVHERSNHLMIFLLIGIGGFLYLIFAKTFLYVGAFIASIGVFSSYALIPSWVTNNIGGQTKRAVAIALVTASGSIGGIVSGQIYREPDAPYYHRGHCIVLGIMSFTVILVLILKFLLKNENRRRKELSSEEREREIVGDGMHSPLDKVTFVYITLINLSIFDFSFSILILFMLHDEQRFWISFHFY